MGEHMAAKKQLNEETEYYIEGLSIATSLDSDAVVVWAEQRMSVVTRLATIHIPCHFYVSRAILASDLIKAFKGCNAQFTVTEENNEVKISWGKKKATLKSRDRATVYVRELDAFQGINDIPEHFTPTLRDVLKDLPAGSDTYSPYIKMQGTYLFWTNRTSVARISIGFELPHLTLHLKDLQKIVTQKNLEVKHLWWSARGSVTFWYTNGYAIQLPTVDESVVGIPDMNKFFDLSPTDVMYTLTDEHFDAVEYVARFTTDELPYIFIEPTFIGTERDPSRGTSVQTEDLPISIVIPVDVAKLGAFKKASRLIRKHDASSAIGFITERENVLFCFSKVNV